MSCIETALSGVWQEALALQGRGSLPNNSNGRLKAAQHEGTVRTAADAGKAPPATADKLNPMQTAVVPRATAAVSGAVAYSHYGCCQPLCELADS
ncbi:hypothetical protein ABBQ38_005523 [Trebouxia sp. C0009 RCD-2024]